MKNKHIDQALSIAIRSAAAAGAIQFTEWYLETGQAPYLGPAIVCGAAAIGLKMPRPRAARQALTSIAPSIFTDEVQTYKVRWKPEPAQLPQKYIFIGNGLPQKLHEETLYRFCRIGWSRQRVAAGDTNTLTRQGETFRRVKTNEILSARYFSRVLRPRFDPLDLQGCYHVLDVTLLKSRTMRGRSGMMYYPPGRTVEMAIIRWQDLTLPPSQRRAFHFAMPRLRN